jgi:predicted Fe-Mo cluster-binding NifX family protein
MKLAIPIWQGRVSSVFDFACKAVVVEWDGPAELDRREVALSGQGPTRIVTLRQLGVDTLICGAISRPLASWASVCGIRLFPYVTGVVNEVIEAFENGQLGSERFVLPGCWEGAKMQYRHRCGWRGGRDGPRA